MTWLRVFIVTAAIAAVVGAGMLAAALKAFDIPADAFGDVPAVPDGFGEP